MTGITILDENSGLPLNEAREIVEWVARNFPIAMTEATTIVLKRAPSGQAYKGSATTIRPKQEYLVRVAVSLDPSMYPALNKGVTRRKLAPDLSDEDVQAELDRLARKGFVAEHVGDTTYTRLGVPVYKRANIRIEHPYGGMRSPWIAVDNWKENLVTMVAHELRHVQQFYTRKPKSEVDCERCADGMLRFYRMR